MSPEVAAVAAEPPEVVALVAVFPELMVPAAVSPEMAAHAAEPFEAVLASAPCMVVQPFMSRSKLPLTNIVPVLLKRLLMNSSCFLWVPL